ncbi:hypothetical protein BGW38_009486 [Lunasporangiospora selenospora]|uniref:DUF4112 domain-containing protein n=1 Tax=Lunasporangiospora selenospora TaxID=979761 RepID=A0A9P6KG56_9FUNG|nr:hypothetical protein BGW38_009486 [Lunasporangiospora selenospora]
MPRRQQDHVIDIPPENHHRHHRRQSSASSGNKFMNMFRSNKKAKVMLSERDAEILASVKRRAKILDTGINLGVVRIGLDPILGLIPVAGDFVTLLMALRLVHTAQKADIPKELTAKMMANIVIDFGSGLVPVIGDVFDFLFKANDRNAKLFEEYLYKRAAAQQADAERAAAAAAAAATRPPPARRHSRRRNSSR